MELFEEYKRKHEGTVPVEIYESDGTDRRTGTYQSPSYIEELKELKLLLDDGIINEEEFTFKKRQILGMGVEVKSD